MVDSKIVHQEVDVLIQTLYDLQTENASLKSAVEKFTAERSKGLGTANNAMVPCPHYCEKGCCEPIEGLRCGSTPCMLAAQHQ